MQLHAFEQVFFHKHKFYLYFWVFYTMFVLSATVSFHQWEAFMKDCKIDIYYHNTSRLLNVPMRVEVKPNDGCRFYNKSVAAVNSSEPFVLSTFECIFYYSENILYT